MVDLFTPNVTPIGATCRPFRTKNLKIVRATVTPALCAVHNTATNEPKKKLKPGLVASYDIWLGNRTGLFWKKQIVSQKVNA